MSNQIEPILGFENTAMLYLAKEVITSNGGLGYLRNNFRVFMKAFDQASGNSQIPLQNSYFDIGTAKAKDNLFFHCYEDIIEHSNRQYRSTFRFEFPRKTTTEVSDMCKTSQQEKRNWTFLWDYKNSWLVQQNTSEGR